MKLPVAIILNGISLKKNFFNRKILPALRSVADVEVFETRSPNDGVFKTGQAIDKGYKLILAAGGDGTVNQVVQGIMNNPQRSGPPPALGIIPLGSGNDFARSLHIRPDALLLTESLVRLRFQTVDVGKITFPASPDSSSLYFINIADAGMGPYVVKYVLDSGRPYGSIVAYYMAILKTFFTYKPVMLEVRTPLWQWSGRARVVAVANGKYFGNGLCIAPDALPDDGVLHCTIVEDVSVWDFIIQQFRLRQGKHVRHPKVSYRDAEWVEIHAQQPAFLEADGEWAGILPVRIELLKKSLQILLP
ncbi:MAG: diacylglycerol kinase family lipid kinase [Cyclobacteriaceae bacterium]|nr:diacylglycerol kinase family lipid kinase [Cyclobacteriaceae bacterium]